MIQVSVRHSLEPELSRTHLSHSAPGPLTAPVESCVQYQYSRINVRSHWGTWQFWLACPAASIRYTDCSRPIVLGYFFSPILLQMVSKLFFFFLICLCSLWNKTIERWRFEWLQCVKLKHDSREQRRAPSERSLFEPAVWTHANNPAAPSAGLRF